MQNNAGRFPVRTICWITLWVCLLGHAQGVGDPAKTRQLIAVLESNAVVFEKARACQQLGETGSGEAVPALAALLGDEHLSAYARSGLEGIPDPQAAAALRAATSRVKGDQLIGVVNSLGVLRDAKAVGTLRKLAADAESGAVKEALLALGRISTDESIRMIREALASGPEQFRAEAAAACLLAAERQLGDGQREKARGLYDAVRGAGVPLSYRVGATRGAILAREKDGIPFLVEQLRSGEPAIRNAALLTIREIPGGGLASALNAELAKATPELQVRLLAAMADCHNADSIKAISARATGADPEVRKAALAVLGRIGGPAAGEVLLRTLISNADAEEISTATDGLKRMAGNDVDELVVKALLTAQEANARVRTIRLIEARGVTSATGELLKQAAASDAEVSRAAFSALSVLAGAGDLAALIELNGDRLDPGARPAAEQAIVNTCARTQQSARGGGTALARLGQATNPELKKSWIRILTSLGHAETLPAIKKAMTDPDEGVASQAITDLGRWPDPGPVEYLLRFTEQTANPEHGRHALAAAIQLSAVAAEEHQRPEPIILTWLQQADTVAQTVETRRRILSVLGRLKLMGSLQLAAGYLDHAELGTEAAQTVVQIAPALVDQGEAGPIGEVLRKISTQVQNASIREQAVKIAQSIPGELEAVFDGASLAGWEGNTNVWRVRDGEIVGGSMNGNPQNEFLALRRPYSNFVLRLEYRLTGSEGFVNGGVQFRSARVPAPANEMSGYQADIGAGHSGCLYDESRRNRFLARAPEEQIKRLEKAGEWNAYEVRCAGPRIQIILNGERTVDYTETDPSVSPAGLIALQIHGGCKAQISFRKLTVAGDRRPGT